MSIVIALIVVLVVGGLITKFYPKPTHVDSPASETLTPTVEVIVESPVETTITTEVIPTTPPSVPTMATKKKKKPHPKKKKPISKVDA